MCEATTYKNDNGDGDSDNTIQEIARDTRPSNDGSNGGGSGGNQCWD